ncbi:hypothetical protein [Streptomyces sp. YIM 98790]|uniref:hypothetical protein n=1 Tax=Streptomyces sp. YIM 98790 TaxID=2689077 RepID=UPI00140AFBE9|nr:hypothetical protein [Streptomyces sp. YIM 98790]
MTGLGLKGRLPAVVHLTGREDLVATAWREFTDALGSRTDVSLTTYRYPAWHMSRAGCRVVKVALDDPSYVREVYADPDGGWVERDCGRECPPGDVVRVALEMIATARPASGGGGGC